MLPGLGFTDIEQRIVHVHRKVFVSNHMMPFYPVEVGSSYRDNPGGEYHDFSSEVITTIHRYAGTLQRDDYLKFRSLIYYMR